MNSPSRLKSVWAWLDDRTGLGRGWCQCAGRTVRPGTWLGSLGPNLIVFLVVVQALTGLVLWMHYSPSATSAWESVYYVQYELAGGWLVRGLHHFSAQVLVAVAVLYVIQLVLARRYQRPREFVFWAAIGFALVALGLCLTGDLLRWDQNSFSATKTRVSFAMLVPQIGGALFQLVAGGPAFGHLTLTRFFALHVGVLAPGLLLLLVLHAWFVRRANQAEAAGGTAVPYWPQQCLRNGVAWLVLLGVLLLLVFQRGLTGDHAGQPPGAYLGVELGAPADTDPAAAYAAARPEWSFRGLYEFAHLFTGQWQILPIFVIPSILMAYFLVIPFIGLSPKGHVVNVILVLALFAANAGLSWKSYRADYADPDYLAALEVGTRTGERAIALAQGTGIPAAGALTLVRTDPLLQGPELFQQHCAACHTYTPPEGTKFGPAEPSAPELAGFASRAWLTAFLDPEQISTAKFYGNTRFASGIMATYVKGHFGKLEEEKRQAIIAALSAEAQLKTQAEADHRGPDLIRRGKELLVSEECTRCHRFHDQGADGDAPDLTGYGSRDWLIGITADPTHRALYGVRNDRMPVYVEAPDQPAKNRLSPAQLDVLASWLRGEWYEPPAAGEETPPAAATGPAGTSALLALGRWDGRRAPVAPAATDPKGQALAVLALAQCALCHDYTDAAGQGLRARQPTAPSLYQFASAEWVRGILDPQQVAGPKYFGTNPEFKEGEMVKFVRSELKGLIKDSGQEVFDKLVAALAAEAQKDSPSEKIDEDTESLFDEFNCSNCHKFYGTGDLGSGPDLTGYGSRQWLVDIMTNPEHERFYPDSNDGMPAYHAFPDAPAKNLLTKEQMQQIADLLRGKLEPAPAKK